MTNHYRGVLFGKGHQFCVYCGKQLALKPDKENTLTVEHIIPLGKGGANSLINMATACKTCNNLRGDGHSERRFSSRNGRPI